MAKQCAYVSSFSNFLLTYEAEIRQKNQFLWKTKLHRFNLQYYSVSLFLILLIMMVF